jgi:hypothetical protein
MHPRAGLPHSQELGQAGSVAGPGAGVRSALSLMTRGLSRQTPHNLPLRASLRHVLITRLSQATGARPGVALMVIPGRSCGGGPGLQAEAGPHACLKTLFPHATSVTRNWQQISRNDLW